MLGRALVSPTPCLLSLFLLPALLLLPVCCPCSCCRPCSCCLSAAPVPAAGPAPAACLLPLFLLPALLLLPVCCPCPCCRPCCCCCLHATPLGGCLPWLQIWWLPRRPTAAGRGSTGGVHVPCPAPAPGAGRPAGQSPRCCRTGHPHRCTCSQGGPLVVSTWADRARC